MYVFRPNAAPGTASRKVGPLVATAVLFSLAVASLAHAQGAGSPAGPAAPSPTRDATRAVAPALSLFDRVVAENGAVVHRPDSGETTRLGPAANLEFLDALRSRGVTPLSAGECIVATWEPHQETVLDTIYRHSRSEESRFWLVRADGRIRLWRRPHKAMDPSRQQGTV